MKKIFTFFFVLLVCSFTAQAQWTHLSDPDLMGVEANDFLNTGTSLLIASEGGINRSVDNGMTWESSNNGLDTAMVGINSLAYLNDIVYACANNTLYKSSDDGVNWVKIELGGELDQQEGWLQSINSTNDKLYIIYQLNSNRHIAYSTDGENWTLGALISNSSNNFSFVQGCKTAVYVVDRDQNKLFKTSDGDVLTELSKIGLSQNLEFRDQSMSVDSTGNTLMLSDEQSATLYRYNVNTNSWDLAMTGILENPSGITPVRVLNDVAFVCTYYMEGEELGMKLYRSVDNGDNWTELQNPGMDFPMFRNEMLKVANNRIIGFTTFGECCYSDNNGATWQIAPVNAFSYNGVVKLPSGKLFVKKGEFGLFSSNDFGQTWASDNGDLPGFNGIYFINELFNHGNKLFVTIRVSPFNEKLFLYNSNNGGLSWDSVATVPDSIYKQYLGHYGDQMMMMFAGEGHQTVSYLLEASAGVWVDFSSGIEALGLSKFYGIMNNDENMFLFGTDNYGMKKIYKGNNSRSGWVDITKGLDSWQNQYIVVNEWGDNDLIPMPVGAFPDTFDYPILPAWNFTGMTHELIFFEFNTLDSSWNMIGDNGLDLPFNTQVNNLSYRNGLWFLSTSAGGYISEDYCRHWAPIYNNNGFQYGMSINRVNVDLPHIFIATNGSGLWMTELHGPNVHTGDVVMLDEKTGKVEAEISSSVGISVKEKGFCIADHILPAIGESGIPYSDRNGGINIRLDFSFDTLTDATTYYVRAYAIDAIDTTYGNQVSFQTSGGDNINDVKFSEGVIVFPNPTTDYCYVTTTEVQGDIEVEVYGVNGTLITKAIANNRLVKIDLSNLPTGLYTVKVVARAKVFNRIVNHIGNR